MRIAVRCALGVMLASITLVSSDASADRRKATPREAPSPALSVADQRALGDALASRIAAISPLIARAEIDEALSAAVGDLDAAGPRRAEIHVLATASIACFDAPGGHVYLSRGLLLACRNRMELRAALAHQLAHARSLDALQNLCAGYGAERVASLAHGEAPHVLDGIAANLAASGALARHGRDTEAIADAGAEAIGASPRAWHALLSRLASRDAQPPSWAPATPWRRLTARYIAAHPVTRERLERLAGATLGAHLVESHAGPGLAAAAALRHGSDEAFARLQELLTP